MKTIKLALLLSMPIMFVAKEAHTIHLSASSHNLSVAHISPAAKIQKETLLMHLENQFLKGNDSKLADGANTSPRASAVLFGRSSQF